MRADRGAVVLSVARWALPRVAAPGDWVERRVMPTSESEGVWAIS